MAKNMNKWLLPAIVVVAVFFLANGGGNGGGSNDDGPSVIVNPTPIDSNVTINMYNKHNRATTLGDTAKVYVDGVLKNSSVSHGGQVVVNPGEKVTIFAAENSTTYYTKKVEMTAENKEAATADIEACQIDTSASLVWFNENDQVNTNVTVGTGGSEDFEVQLKATSDTCLGNPDIDNGAGVGLYYNTDTWTKVELSGASSVSCPGFLDGGTDFVWKCYEFAALEDSNVAKFRDTIALEAVSSIDPAPANNTMVNVTVRLIDKDYDFNARTDAEIIGYQDEDANDLGDTTTQQMEVLFI